MRFRDLKKQQKKQQSQSQQEQLHYVSYPDKIKALITDMFMIYAPILYIITYLIMGGKDDFQSSQLAPFVGVSMYGLVYAILLAKFGQTPGKKAYVMKVVDAKTQEQIGFFRALCRFVAFLFSATILFGVLLPLFRKDKKALHDIICGTIEIYV
jgi:uncharacterized RDD family membrane protein YckC